MKRGEIRWFKFPYPNKKRPVLILTRTEIIEYINEITIVPITSTIRDIPSEVILTRLDGMTKNCAVSCDHIQTISKQKIGNLITSLNEEKMSEVQEAVMFALGF